MSRLFLSVLGRGIPVKDQPRYEYAECVYRSAAGESLPSTRYIQEASVRLFCHGWRAAQGDRVRILCTEQSFGYQWGGEGHLSECLNRLKSEPGYADLDFSGSAVKMPEGRSKEEIWQIFNVLFSCVNEGDEIWLDVTHGFRSIPMLVLTAVPYLRLLKKAEVKSITYGAYEAKGSDGTVPIFDLTDFVGLMDWTNAAGNFVRYGIFDDCKKLMEEANRPIMKATAGKDAEGVSCRDVSKAVDNFTQALIQNHLEDVIVPGVPSKVFENIAQLENAELRIAPLGPLMQQISSKLKPFEKNSYGNVFTAVRWCIDHKLLQNGFSILFEGCISIAVRKLVQDGLVPADLEKEEATRGIPVRVSLEWAKEKESEQCPELEQRYRNSMFNGYQEYAKKFEELNKARNQYMHCGTSLKEPVAKIDLTKQLTRQNCVDGLAAKLAECNQVLEKWYKELNIEKDN